MNEKLYEELVQECDRLTCIINEEDPGSDKWKMAYERKLAILEKMTAFNKIETEYYTKQEDRRVVEEHNKEMLEMEKEKLKQHEAIEKSKREAEIALEQEKQKITWKRIGFEMGKVLIPLLITAAFRQRERNEIFDFETHGRITSTVGRQFRLTDIYWKK